MAGGCMAQAVDITRIGCFDAAFFENQEYEKAEAIYRLLIDAFDDYAEGHNYLGLIALEQERIDEALYTFPAP